MKIINFFKPYFTSSNIDQVITGGIILMAILMVILVTRETHTSFYSNIPFSSGIWYNYL